jgi:hypothetical protein
MLRPIYFAKVEANQTMRERHDLQDSDSPERSFSISHLVHTLRRYASVILLSLIAVAVGYAILAAALYALAPAERVTSIQFRLDFEGADRGEYPNGIKFSPSEVLSAPVLLKVYKENELGRYNTSFTKFSRSLVVLESNLELERIVREFQSRLSDPRLTSVERDRIQREYESRMQSVRKGQFSLSYMRPASVRQIPEEVVRKTLHDILREWTNYIANEQHVLEYRIPVIAPTIVDDTLGEGTNPIVKVAMLRSKVQRVLANIELIRRLPSAELVRTEKENVSLNDISIRLDDIVRFRLDPLIQRAAAAGLDNRTDTIRFLETQLAYDERRLSAQERVAAAAQQTLTVYAGKATTSDDDQVRPSAPAAGEVRPQPAASNGAVVPQLSDSFIERLVQLTSNAADTEYRQKLANDYRVASLGVVPLQEAVAYDKAMLEFVRGASGGSGITPAEVDQQIASTRAEVRKLVQQLNDIYKLVSANLNPTTELLTPLNVPTTRVARSIGITKLALYGILTMLLALPLTILLCLLHNRVREEEEEEEGITRSDAVGTTA